MYTKQCSLLPFDVCHLHNVYPCGARRRNKKEKKKKKFIQTVCNNVTVLRSRDMYGPMLRHERSIPHRTAIKHIKQLV